MEPEATATAELALAERMARFAHRGQKEESTGDDYILHVERVVALTAGGADAKAVAWLHDVVEDCDLFGNDPDDLLRVMFSAPVVEAVLELTRGWHVATAEPYADYIEHIRLSGNDLALKVKLADLADHLRPNCPERLRKRYERAWQALTGTPWVQVQEAGSK